MPGRPGYRRPTPGTRERVLHVVQPVFGYCPMCGRHALVMLTPAQLLLQPDATNAVCHPTLGGCNQGYERDGHPTNPLAKRPQQR